MSVKSFPKLIMFEVCARCILAMAQWRFAIERISVNENRVISYLRVSIGCVSCVPHWGRAVEVNGCLGDDLAILRFDWHRFSDFLPTKQCLWDFSKRFLRWMSLRKINFFKLLSPMIWGQLFGLPSRGIRENQICVREKSSRLKCHQSFISGSSDWWWFKFIRKKPLNHHSIAQIIDCRACQSWVSCPFGGESFWPNEKVEEEE